MADHSISFKIGSEFSGEGFKKARNDIADVNKSISKGISAASQLSGAFGEMDASAAKSMRAMTGLAEAILSFNATTIAVQVGVLAINKYFGDLKDRCDAAREAANALKAEVDKAFSAELADQIASCDREVKSIIGDFDAVTKQAQAFSAAIESVRGSVAQGGIVNLEVEKLNAMLAAHTDAQREAVEATYNIKIAHQKAIDSEAEWTEKVSQAHDAVVANNEKISKIEEQMAAAERHRLELEETMVIAKESNDPKWREIQQAIMKIEDKERTLHESYSAALGESQILAAKEQKAKQDALNAQGQATVAIRQAELAEQKLTEAKNKRAYQEAAAERAAEEKAAIDRQETSLVKDAVSIQQSANQAAKDLEAAERDFAAKLAAFQTPENLTAMLSRDYVKNGGKAGLLPVDVQKGIQMTVADKAVDDAIRNGTVNTVKDANRLQRQAMRETRDAITKEQRQQIAEAKKYERLKEMNPKALASSDRDFMTKYEKITAAAEKRKDDLEKAKESVDKSKTEAEKSAKSLEKIERQLAKLGLR